MTDDEWKRLRFDHAVLAATHIDHKLLASERALMDSKWPAYFWMTPWQATEHFYKIYLERERWFVEANVDRDTATTLKRSEFGPLAAKGKLTHAWTARQRADMMSVPYELFIDHCMHFWGRRSGEGRKRAPRINQLGYTEMSCEPWHIIFLERAEGELGLHHRAFAERVSPHMVLYSDTPEQEAVRDLVIEWAAQASGSWAGQVEKWVYDLGVLKPLHFRRHMDLDALRDAVKSTDRSSKPCLAPAGPWMSRISCFGLPEARADVARCRACPVAENCGGVAQKVREVVKARSGFEDPVAERKRAQGRKRKAKHVLKKKLAGATGKTSSASSVTAP